MELQDFPPELQEMILEELHELYRKAWQQRLNVVNSELHNVWDGRGYYGVYPYTFDPKIEYIIRDSRSESHDGCLALYRDLSTDLDSYYRIIWNWNTKTKVGHVPDCY